MDERSHQIPSRSDGPGDAHHSGHAGLALWRDARVVSAHVHAVHSLSPSPRRGEDTPGRKDGILIGRVHDVRFADEDAHAHNDEGVVVTVKIDGNRKLRRSEIPRISASLLGDAVVQFVKGDRPQTKELFQDSDYIEGSVANNPLQALNDLQGNIGEAITSVSTAGNEVGKLAQHLDRLITSNDEQIGRIVNKTEHALDGFQQTLSNINSVFGMDQAHGGVQGALQEAPDVDSTQPADPAAADFRRRTATLPEVLREAGIPWRHFAGRSRQPIAT